MAALLTGGSAGFIPSFEGGEFSTGYMGIFAPALTQVRLAEAALARIAGRNYGCCLRCDKEITMKRLTALPHASRCIACQERAEHGESREPGVLKELAGNQSGI
jgi:hypothetical protein